MFLPFFSFIFFYLLHIYCRYLCHFSSVRIKRIVLSCSSILTISYAIICICICTTFLTLQITIDAIYSINRHDIKWRVTLLDQDTMSHIYNTLFHGELPKIKHLPTGRGESYIFMVIPSTTSCFYSCESCTYYSIQADGIPISISSI
jgi:hypothetical protein